MPVLFGVFETIDVLSSAHAVIGCFRSHQVAGPTQRKSSKWPSTCAGVCPFRPFSILFGGLRHRQDRGKGMGWMQHDATKMRLLLEVGSLMDTDSDGKFRVYLLR